MDVHLITSTISEFINELELALARCKKGILKVDIAKELIKRIRKELSEMLPKDSDAYEIYNRYDLENNIWWDVDTPYVEKSNLSIFEKEIEQLKTILNEINPDLTEKNKTNTDEHHFNKGDFSSPRLFIYELMRSAQNSIVIIDSYIDESIFKYIKSLDKSITFKILTNERGLKPIVQEIAEQCLKEDWNIMIKGTNNFHDRYIIIDDEEIWHVGASIKDLGNKEFT